MVTPTVKRPSNVKARGSGLTQGVHETCVTPATLFFTHSCCMGVRLPDDKRETQES